MLALVIVRKNRDVKIRREMEKYVKFLLLFTGRHFWNRRCRKKTWWQQEFFMIEAKAQGDYADRKGTVQNGEKKQFVG